MTPTHELRGLRAAFDAYRSAIETAVRLDEKTRSPTSTPWTSR